MESTEKTVSLAEIIRFLDKHPKMLDINSNVKPKKVNGIVKQSKDGSKIEIIGG